jgi:hypothetical protein
MRICCGVLIGALACWGQSVTVGAVGGARATGDMGSGLDSPASVSNRYVFGPSVEIGLPRRFGIEVEALYRSQGSQTQSSGFVVSSSERANSFEFPVLLKYRPLATTASPFLEAGYAPRVVSTRSAMATTSLCAVHPLGCVQPVTGNAAVNSIVDWPVSHGVIVGVGAQFAASRFRIAPSVRYTRWSNTAFSADVYSNVYGSWRLAHNQLDVLLNIGWKLR